MHCILKKTFSIIKPFYTCLLDLEFICSLSVIFISPLTLILMKQIILPLPGPVPLLKLEINRLEEENGKLRGRLEKLEIDCSNILQEKGILQEQMNKLRRDVSSNASAPNIQIENLKTEIQKLEDELSRCNMKSSNTSSVPDDYVSTKHQLLAVQSQLEKVLAIFFIINGTWRSCSHH